MRSPLTRGIGAGAALATAGSLLLMPQVAVAAEEPETTDIQILGINDFHGRIEADDYNGLAGAAGLVATVRAYEAANPNTLFVSAGDNIGASTFTSFIQQDEPTMEALAKGGLDVGVVGNHEFDQGFADLTDRVQPYYDAASGIEGLGADLTLGANVYDAGTTDPALQEYTIKDVDGVKIGFIGTITSTTETLVSPAGISQIDFGDQVEAANRVAAEIDDQVDVTILLTHSGAEVSGSDSSTCEEIAAEETEFGDLVRDASPEIDAILSGHTHQGYPCTIGGRPVLQANDYGSTLAQLDLSVDSATKELVSIGGSLVSLTDEAGAPINGEAEDILEIVNAAVEFAAVQGNEPVGEITADILRGGEPAGADRGVESTMGNLVADVYLWSTTEYANYGGEPADIAVMNPGGLRDDLLFASSEVGEGDGVVTYAEAAAVQPFANTLTTSELTGADIEQMLEEQWQPGNDRPKLHLGISEGFSYEYIDSADAGEHVVSMTLNGEPVLADETYTVTTNSFIAAGGDGFTAFTNAPYRDTGLIDLSATVDFFATSGAVDPAPLGRAIAVEDPTEPGNGSGAGSDGSAGSGSDGSAEGGSDGSAGAGSDGSDASDGAADGSNGSADAGSDDAGTGSDDATVTPDEADLTDDTENLIAAPGSATPGAEITIVLPEQVTGTVETFMFSTPVSLGSQQVSADSTISVTIPADAPAGTHRLAVYDADGTLVGWTTIEITGGDLLATGGEMTGTLGWGLGLAAAALIAAGILLTARTRRA
ncbi:bifunctional metallophosphatase/5'-nucleotidase [Microbacterium excoecariae]|uniref:bifunctional metallophosphatase/5'-nucleotidase n=1 Tax=Microbacterium excoecariae TaxID=2715210 RepID=UPI001407F106|nr:bifunctional UDP-sugar hydrolase/5'-nucleotidase [Microbacterium excoecariae]